MPGLLDLPNELLPLIWRELRLPALISTCRASRRIHESSPPYLCHAFQKSSTPARTRERLRHFFQLIKKYPFVRLQVRSVIIDDLHDDRSIRMLRSLIVPLLSCTPNLRRLAIPGHPRVLSLLRPALQNSIVSLQTLQELRCVECHPKIWEIVGSLPKLYSLFLKHLQQDGSPLHLSAASLSIQAIVLEECDLDSKVICAVIESCKRLAVFHYLRPRHKRGPNFMQRNPFLDIGEIHNALLLHKNDLEELVIQDHEYGMFYDEFPKFGSFEDFTSLARLGVDYYNISLERSLPPTLNSIAVRQCSNLRDELLFEVLLYLGKHASLRSISLDSMLASYIFQKLESSRKDIQIHVQSQYAPYSGASASNIVAHPLPWVDPSTFLLS